MKIVITSDFYTPMINGVATSSYNLAHGLAARGHEVLVVTASLTGKYSIRAEDKVKLARLSSIRMPLYPDQVKKLGDNKKILGLYRNGLRVSLAPYNELARTLDNFHPDIIHNQTPGPIGLAAFRYARRRDVPIVATGHAYPDNITSQLRYLKLIKKPTDAVVRKYFLSFLEKADYATVPTQLAMDDLLPSEGIATPTEALSNGIDLSRFHPKKAPARIYQKYHIPEGHPIIGYVGRVDPEKSLSVLVEAFAKSINSSPEARLVIVGDGTDLEHLKDLSVELGIADQVIFTGKITGNDLPLIYRTFDIFAITSETETQSIVLMEALATGLPAVAVEAGAIGELVQNGQNGFLCQPKDIAAVSHGLTQLLQDPELRKSYGTASQKLIKTHDIAHTLTRFEQIYTSVLESKNSTIAPATTSGRS